MHRCENLWVHSKSFAPKTKHFCQIWTEFLQKMPISPNIWVSLIILSTLSNMLCMLAKYLSTRLSLKNKNKIHSKKPNLRKTYFVIFLTKINFLGRLQKSLLLICFEVIEQNTVKKAKFWRILVKLCYYHQYCKIFCTGC